MINRHFTREELGAVLRGRDIFEIVEAAVLVGIDLRDQFPLDAAQGLVYCNNTSMGERTLCHLEPTEFLQDKIH